MSIKKKSVIITFGSILSIVIVMGVVAYSYILSDFQAIENQRVEQNLNRLEYILKDKINQIDSKLSDWAMWDDTYYFMNSRDKKYLDTNFSQDTFIKLGVDEVLMINPQGGLVTYFAVDKNTQEDPYIVDHIYSHFATGSALVQIDNLNENKSGILSINNTVHLFSVREIIKSDGSGPSNGVIIFVKHLDLKQLDSLKSLTQFNVVFLDWNASGMREVYMRGKKREIRIIDRSNISGILVIEDVYGKPQGALRTDMDRQIMIRGEVSIIGLLIMLIVTAFFISYFNILLLNRLVLSKILTISKEMKEIGDSNSSKKRLTNENGNDEIALLRTNINKTLAEIESSQTLIQSGIKQRESLIDLIDSIVVMLDPTGVITVINKRGCEVLGAAKEDLMGKNWLNTVIPEGERQMVQRAFSDLVNNELINASAYFENTIITKDKKLSFYGWHNTVVKNEVGVIVSTVSIGNDITESKKQEEEKENFTQALQRMNDVMVGRELKMIELKKRIAELEKKS